MGANGDRGDGGLIALLLIQCGLQALASSGDAGKYCAGAAGCLTFVVGFVLLMLYVTGSIGGDDDDSNSTSASPHSEEDESTGSFFYTFFVLSLFFFIILMPVGYYYTPRRYYYKATPAPEQLKSVEATGSALAPERPLLALAQKDPV